MNQCSDAIVNLKENMMHQQEECNVAMNNVIDDLLNESKRADSTESKSKDSWYRSHYDIKTHHLILIS